MQPTEKQLSYISDLKSKIFAQAVRVIKEVCSGPSAEQAALSVIVSGGLPVPASGQEASQQIKILSGAGGVDFGLAFQCYPELAVEIRGQYSDRQSLQAEADKLAADV